MKATAMIIAILLAQLGYSQIPDDKTMVPDVMPGYAKGDLSSMADSIFENLKKLSTELNYAGTIYVQLTIDMAGNVSNPSIYVRNVAPKQINNELLRLVQLIKFNPAIKDGKAITYTTIAPFMFKP